MLEKMGLATETNRYTYCTVINGAWLSAVSCNFQWIASFKTDLRLMAKSSNGVKPKTAWHDGYSITLGPY